MQTQTKVEEKRALQERAERRDTSMAFFYTAVCIGIAALVIALTLL